MATRVLGADFSGAADAGASIWVTEARHTPDGLVVEDCYRGSEKWGRDRESAHAGLRDRVTAGFDVAGLDFPFSLPAAVLEDRCGGTWPGLLGWLTGDGPGGPDAFVDACRASAEKQAGTASLRRETDCRRAAMCPYGPQVAHQTFHGVRNVLAPLADRDDATVVPMQGGGAGETGGRDGAVSGRDGAGSAVRVVEVYPAATFGWLGCYREGYKGADRGRRATNCDAAEACSVDLGGFRDDYERSHDALDSLAAAVSAGRVGHEPVRYGPREEGHIYV